MGYWLDRTDDMLLLPSAWTYEARLPPKARIPKGWDTTIPIINGTCTDAFCSSLPQHRPGEPVSVPGCCTSAYYFTDRIERPEYGSRSGIRLISRNFEDPWVSASLYHRLTKRTNKLYRVCFCYLVYGQGYYLIMVHRIHSSLHHV